MTQEGTRLANRNPIQHNLRHFFPFYPLESGPRVLHHTTQDLTGR